MRSLRSLRRKQGLGSFPIPMPTDEELIKAVRFGNVTQVKVLLEQGANPCAPDEMLGNALDHALYRDDVKKAELLVSYMPDVNQKGLFELTALHQAASSASIVASEVCTFLLDHGADINAMDREGWTPLMKAVDSKNFNIARLLLERGADTALRDCDGNLALGLLRRAKGYMALRKLLEQAS
jgi:ankyrin repeat protein